MKHIFPFAAILFLAFTTVPSGKWTLDNSHSRLGFVMNHMGIAELQGDFRSVNASITSKGNDFSDAVIELTAQTSSINTGFQMRDDHLKTADFFDVEKFPELNFKSSSVKKIKGSDREYEVLGKLTLHGITKEVSLKAVHTGSSKTKSGSDLAGFKVTGTIKRSDFGIGSSLPSSVASDEVQLNADIEVALNQQ
jgi:polyisoprenoid-binding protein YceI